MPMGLALGYTSGSTKSVLMFPILRQSEQDQGIREGLSRDERERLKALARENRELKRANEILRQASAYFAQAELDRRRK